MRWHFTAIRATPKILDIWCERTPENAARLLRVLDDFGFGSSGLVAQDFMTPAQTIQLGHPPNRIDLITSLEGLDFATCYPLKLEETFQDVCIVFIDREHLKESKRLAGRHQDLADIENLTE